MKLDKKSLFIVLVSFFAFLIVRNTDDPSVKLQVIKVALLLTTLTFIIKEAFFNLKELKSPSNNIPRFLIKMQKPTADASDKGAIGLFLMLIGFVNLKLKFLGGGTDKLPDSFQYPFSISLIILGVLGFFLFVFNKSKKFQKFIIRRYQSFSKIIFYTFMLAFIFLITSMITPFIWR